MVTLIYTAALILVIVYCAQAQMPDKTAGAVDSLFNSNLTWHGGIKGTKDEVTEGAIADIAERAT